MTAVDSSWAQLDPMASFTADIPDVAGVSTDVAVGGLGIAGVSPQAGRFSPDNPMFWVLVIGGCTFGLIGVSTHLRLGPFKASGSAGKNS